MEPSCTVSAVHALRFSGPMTNIQEAPAIGNGDLAALVQVFQDEFRLSLGKNDVWDARCDHVAADWVYSQDDLIRAGRDYGFRLEGGTYDGRPAWDRPPPPELARYVDHGAAGWDRVFPCPKPVGCIRIRHSGISSTRVETVVDIARGVVTTSFRFDYDWHGWGGLIVEAWVDRDANAVRLRLRREGLLGDVRLCLEKLPDGLDPTIPPPTVQRLDDWHGLVAQQIPGGYDVAPFTWTMAGAFPASAPGHQVRPVQAHVYRLWQAANLDAGQSLESMVGVATDRDGSGDRDARAAELAGPATAAAYDDALARHTRSWADFWSRSGVSLGDPELEKTWYRNLFALACHISPRGQAPGLCANVAPWESSPWHGGYTVNMNIQKMFLSSLPSNHPEWIECYANWVDHLLPSFRHLAQLTFGLEGLHSPHMVMPYVPPHRQATSNQCGRALGMTGWHAQPLWWHWEYTRDREFLRQRTYPYLKAVADFYCRYLDKYLDESGDLYPSLNLEGPPWTKDFRHNRDCFIDLVLFRDLFQWAIQAATILDVDADSRARWQTGLDRVREPRCERLPDGQPFAWGDKNAPLPDGPEWWENRGNRAGQAVTAAWMVFPGEYMEGDEPEGRAAAAREIMQRTRWYELHPEVIWIHHWWCAIPALRMRLPDAFELARKVILRERYPAGHARTTHWINLQPDAWRVPEDNYLGVAATTEMLLQSQGEVIRLFPNWPRQLPAAFRGLPARGGFLVAATWVPDRGLEAEIRSQVPGTCTLRWADGLPVPEVREDGQPVAVVRMARAIRFACRSGGCYTFTSKELPVR